MNCFTIQSEEFPSRKLTQTPFWPSITPVKEGEPNESVVRAKSELSCCILVNARSKDLCSCQQGAAQLPLLPEAWEVPMIWPTQNPLL